MTLYVQIDKGQIVSGAKVDRNEPGWVEIQDSAPRFDPSYQTLTKGEIAVVDGFPVQQYAVTDFLDLAALIAQRRAEVSAALEAKATAGITIQGVNAPVQMRDGDRANLDGAVMQASLSLTNPAVGWAPGFAWRLADNSMLPLPTPQSVIGFGVQIAAAYLALRVQAWAHKDAIAQLKDVASVAAYDITKGW